MWLLWSTRPTKSRPAPPVDSGANAKLNDVDISELPGSSSPCTCTSPEYQPKPVAAAVSLYGTREYGWSDQLPAVLVSTRTRQSTPSGSFGGPMIEARP